MYYLSYYNYCNGYWNYSYQQTIDDSEWPLVVRARVIIVGGQTGDRREPPENMIQRQDVTIGYTH